MIAAGGLHIIGTERHESRRIDNQLRGRSGRQGDPGSSRFYLSMEDNLMRIFGDPNRTKRLLQFAGMKEGEVIESGMLTRQIEKAQRKVESHNFDIRKQLLLFDDVANDQRKVIYQQRTEILGTADMSAAITGMFEEAAASLIDQFVVPNSVPQDWNLEGLQRGLAARLQSVDLSPGPGWRPSRSWRRRRCARACSGPCATPTSRRSTRVRRADHAPRRARRGAAHARSALARAPGGDGIPAPGHPPARLRAEGLPLRVQARGLRAVLGDARSGEVRHACPRWPRSRCAPRSRSTARRPSGASG